MPGVKMKKIGKLIFYYTEVKYNTDHFFHLA
jgi:hypothetical protein